MKNLKIIILSTIFSLGMIACTTGSEAPKETKTVKNSSDDEKIDAKALIKESCSKCHDGSVYTKKDRKIKSLASLEKRVRACDANIGANLEPEEMKAISTFLNNEYYKF